MKKIYSNFLAAREQNPLYGKNYFLAEHNGQCIVRIEPLYEDQHKWKSFCAAINTYLEKYLLQLEIQAIAVDRAVKDNKTIGKI